jgi:hypothetical protein
VVSELPPTGASGEYFEDTPPRGEVNAANRSMICTAKAHERNIPQALHDDTIHVEVNRRVLHMACGGQQLRLRRLVSRSPDEPHEIIGEAPSQCRAVAARDGGIYAVDDASEFARVDLRPRRPTHRDEESDNF